MDRSFGEGGGVGEHRFQFRTGFVIELTGGRIAFRTGRFGVCQHDDIAVHLLAHEVKESTARIEGACTAQLTLDAQITKIVGVSFSARQFADRIRLQRP
jgi:hypothetical protein